MSGETADKLAALEEARARLELSLGSDENWRALLRSEAREDDWSAERQARDARLTRALDDNPLYRAWQHITEAIDKLREASQPAPAEQMVSVAQYEAGGSAFMDAPPPGSPAEVSVSVEQPTSDVAAELPEDIRAILRRDTADLTLASDTAPSPVAESEGAATSRPDTADAHEIAGEGPTQNSDEAVEIVVQEEGPDETAEPTKVTWALEANPASEMSPVRADLAALTSRIDRLDAQLREFDTHEDDTEEVSEEPEIRDNADPEPAEHTPTSNGAVETREIAAAEGADKPLPEVEPSSPVEAPPSPQDSAEPIITESAQAAPTRRPRSEAEATVTFVTQEPQPILAHAETVELADGDGATELFARAPEADAADDSDESARARTSPNRVTRETFIPSTALLEEAEVTIVTPEKIIPPEQPSKLPSGPISRFLRALSGD